MNFQWARERHDLENWRMGRLRRFKIQVMGRGSEECAECGWPLTVYKRKTAGGKICVTIFEIGLTQGISLRSGSARSGLLAQNNSKKK